VPTYCFKVYQRTRQEGTTGELVSREQFEAAGMAQAHLVVAPALSQLDFKSKFAVLEGSTDYVTCWLTEAPHT